MWKGWVSGHWEKSKQSGYVHLLYCSSDGRLKAEGTAATLANFLYTGRITVGARLDVVCCGISNTTLLASMLMTAPPHLHLAVPSLSLQAFSSPEDEGLPQRVHLLAQQTWNYCSFGYMLTDWFPDPRTCGEGLGTRLKCAIVEGLRIQEGTFPRPSPTFSFTS